MDPTPQELVETLRLAQRLGFFGDGPIDSIVSQGELFATGLGGLEAGATVVDLGSGGGSPGLVAAWSRPDLHFTLIDRRQKRTDFLQRARSRLGLSNVAVLCDDVVSLADRVTECVVPAFDGLTARGFGPFRFLVDSICILVRPGGLAVVSDPPGPTRWTPEALDGAPLTLVTRLGVTSELAGGVSVLQRLSD